MALTAIETQYNGYRFRSRLEARWAVFFDALGVRYEYEKEGFELPDVGRYLPDFWLTDLDCWIEIKATYPSDEEKARCLRLARESGKFVFLLYGDCQPITVRNNSYGVGAAPDIGINGSKLYFAPSGDSDGMMDFGICPGCGLPILGHWGNTHAISYSDEDANRVCPTPSNHKVGFIGSDHPRVLEAYRAARSARFEFGETPSRH